MIRLLLSTFALLALCDNAFAWGDLGHKIICEIAVRLVQPDTRAAVRRLIEADTEFKTFADSCVFPDHLRRRASEHFINLPRDAKGLASDECPQADKCVLTAILADSKVLASKAETDVLSLMIRATSKCASTVMWVPGKFWSRPTNSCVWVPEACERSCVYCGSFGTSRS